MRGKRLAVIFGSAALVIGGAQVSQAAPTKAAGRPLVVSDPRGDAVQGTRGDLVGLTLATRGEVRGGRYNPHSLVIQIDLADAVDRSGRTRYELTMALPGCSRSFRAYVNPGNPADRGVSCHTGSDDLTFTMDRKPTVSNSRITWVVPFGDFPSGALSGGQTARDIRAWSSTTDPRLTSTGETASVLPAQLIDDDELVTNHPFTLR